jgi:hypothetical protein
MSLWNTSALPAMISIRQLSCFEDFATVDVSQHEGELSFLTQTVAIYGFTFERPHCIISTLSLCFFGVAAAVAAYCWQPTTAAAQCAC